MAENKKDKSPIESFGDMVKEFGEAISKIFSDPELKKKAKEFAKSAEESAKAFGKRFKDEGVKDKFKDFGKAARNFGESVSDYFKDDKEKEEDINQKEFEWEKKLDEKMKNFGEKTEKAGKEFGRKIEEVGDKVDHYFKGTRGGRITGYSFAIMWSVIFFVFFNFYQSYIAYYHYDGIWHRYPLLTKSFSQWLPIVSVALVASMIGSILLIIYDGYFFRQIIRIVLNLFGLTAIISLLTVFPFDFTVFPRDLTGILNPVVITVLILIIIGIGIETMVRLIKLIVNAAGSP
ncbi:MAG: hypothetical protein FJW63_03315 [Actinobacteria bacterium]|nr:hypothetical protein [Actinomycetota bacterium]